MWIPLSVVLLVALFTATWTYFYTSVGGRSPYRGRLEAYHGHRPRRRAAHT